MKKPIIGIMGAEPKEVEGIVNLLDNHSTLTFGMRDYHQGLLNGIDVVVVYSRCGKTAAATTVTALIHHFQITKLIFTGVAGAIHQNLAVGDLVIGSRLLQHDVDVRPFRPQFEIPILGITYFESDKDLQEKATTVAQKLLDSTILEKEIGAKVLQQFGITKPSLATGDIASGDQFISSQEKKNDLANALPNLLCTEMEGAAVAQVCYEYDLPFVVIRTISDSANEAAGIDFPAFLEQVASKYSAVIVKELLASLQN